MRYGSVVFDMDGVILDFRGDGFEWKYDAVREALRELDEEDVELDNRQMESLLGTFGKEKFFETAELLDTEPRTTWERMAAKTSEARIEMIKNGGFQLFEDAKPAMKWLRSEGVPLAVISNAPGPGVEETVEEFELKSLLKFYRGIETWDDFHRRKPNPELLEMAGAELKREPFIYVGDRETDVEAAERAGMDSCWLNRTGKEMDQEHDHEISSLERLSDVVSN